MLRAGHVIQLDVLHEPPALLPRNISTDLHNPAVPRSLGVFGPALMFPIRHRALALLPWRTLAIAQRRAPVAALSVRLREKKLGLVPVLFSGLTRSRDVDLGLGATELVRNIHDRVFDMLIIRGWESNS